MSNRKAEVLILQDAMSEDGDFLVVLSIHGSVSEALDAIRTRKHGDGPFDVVTVNRRGVKLATEEVVHLDEGEKFGGRGSASDD